MKYSYLIKINVNNSFLVVLFVVSERITATKALYLVYMINVLKEIKFKTARSGGKGGQNVNKVETMVEGYWEVSASLLFSDEEKETINNKLANRITDGGILLIKSQEERSQLGNKELVIKKMNSLIKQALIKPKKRKPTRPSKAAKEKRIGAKKIKGEIKSGRKKININNA